MKVALTILLSLMLIAGKSQTSDSSNYYIILDTADIQLYDTAKIGCNKIYPVKDNVGDWVVPYSVRYTFPDLFDWIMDDDIVPLGYDDFPHKIINNF